MKFARILVGDEILEISFSGERPPVAGLLLPPATPRQIFGVGLNFADHIGETGSLQEVPQTPVIFMKPLSSLAAPGQAVRIPHGVGRVDYEGELAVVVGETLHRADPEEARKAIRGYTLALDVTARDLQKAEPQWIRAKGFMTFCPLGPYLVPEFPEHAALITRVNNEIRQKAPLSAMIRKPWEILSFISQFAVLFPDDVVLLGTPRGVGPLTPGDRVDVEVPEIGMLSVSVEAEDA